MLGASGGQSIKSSCGQLFLMIFTASFFGTAAGHAHCSSLRTRPLPPCAPGSTAKAPAANRGLCFYYLSARGRHGCASAKCGVGDESEVAAVPVDWGPAADVMPPARAAGPHLPPEATADAHPTAA
jgi:hypothetical protein